MLKPQIVYQADVTNYTDDTYNKLPKACRNIF